MKKHARIVLGSLIVMVGFAPTTQAQQASSRHLPNVPGAEFVLSVDTAPQANAQLRFDIRGGGIFSQFNVWRPVVTEDDKFLVAVWQSSLLKAKELGLDVTIGYDDVTKIITSVSSPYK